MTTLTEAPKHYPLVACLVLACVFWGATGGPLVPAHAASSEAPPSPAADDKATIAYVRLSTHDIHLIAPDGTGDRVLWTAPRPVGARAQCDLEWRPDGRELAFTGFHENASSWYDSDIYVIGRDGTGYRRVTNAPAAAVLASLPKGSVTVNVNNWTTDRVWVYVAGAPEVKSVAGNGTMTFDDVADFGPGVPQPSIGVYGKYRIMSSQPLADVEPGKTVPGGNIVISKFSLVDGFGAGKVSWTADGKTLAYAMRSCSDISQISATPPNGSIGRALPAVKGASPGRVAWSPAAATKDQYLYSSSDNPLVDDIGGIYLNTVGDASGGKMLVRISLLGSAEVVHDLQWLPDASGLVFTKRHVPLNILSDIFEYNFGTKKVKKLTSLTDDSARGLDVSPDGQQIVFERVSADVANQTCSLWIVNRDGSGLHKLADDAATPAWGKAPQPSAPEAR